MDSFSSNFQEILTIMTDPTSYIEYKSSSESSESFESIMYEIIKQYKKIQQLQETQINFTPIIEIFKKIIPSEIKIDYSDLAEYFEKVMSLSSNPVCSCYVQNHDNLEKYSDDAIIKSSELFMGFHCKTCGHFDREHKPCVKYVHTDDYYCQICGLVNSSHTICMNYDGIKDDCNTCGFSWYKHQDKYDEMKIDDCGNFSPHPACTSRCSNCIFNNTHHKFSKKFHSLNSISKDKIRDLWFDITADFIELSESDRLKVFAQYIIIDQMLTNRL
jgi:hypothetical protein